MAQTNISLQMVTDCRQMRREMSALSEEETRRMAIDMHAGKCVMWIETEVEGTEITVTPRLCFG